jgi:hypothetical protein
MRTECSRYRFHFQPLGRREVVARFDGGTITSDAGALLLREVERKTGILAQFAGCFADHRDPELIEHRVGELVAQRVYALALGYEDLNDHDQLRFDPLLATLVGKTDPTGQRRVCRRDQGKPLAGKSTLNRLELTPVGANRKSRYQKITARSLYEEVYCGRGEMENRIKEQQLYLFADRTSAETMRANQLRLFFSSITYTLMEALRRLGLAGTSMAQAQCHTIRWRPLKIGAQIRVTVRKVWISLAEGYPWEALFRQVYRKLAEPWPSYPPLRC